MSEPPDAQALAERYLDLWERQTALLAAVPEGAPALAAWLAAVAAASEAAGAAGPTPTEDAGAA